MNEVFGMLSLVTLAVVIGALPSQPLANCDPHSAQAQSLRRAELRGTMVLALGGVTAGLALHAFIGGAPWVGLLVVALGVVTFFVMHPGPFVRTLLVPLGAWRLAMVASRWGGPPWLRDPEGGAVLMGTLALSRRPGTGAEQARAELESRLSAAPLRGAGVVAVGLLAAHRGDTAAARRLLLSVDELDPEVCPPLCRAIANDWLLQDAADRERWTEVEARTDHSLSLSASSRLLQIVARRLLGRASRFELFKAWLVAPRRWQTLGLLDQAWDETPAELPVVDRELTRLAANGLGPLGSTAPSLHLDAVRQRGRGGLRPEVLQRLGLAWDEALWDLGARGRVRARSRALDCNETVEDTVVELHRELCVEIAALMPPNGPIPTSGRTLQRAIELFASAQRHRMHCALTFLRDAVRAPISPRSAQLWSAWLEVRDGYALHEQTGLGDAREVFGSVEQPLAHVVHWLWHHRSERPMANAIATWLALEAERIRDDASAQYHRQYVAAGP